MQFLTLDKDTKLKDFSDEVGSRNADYILAANSIDRTPNIGKKFYEDCEAARQSTAEVSWQRKSQILNTFTQDSDIFETAALLGESDWKVLSSLNTFPGMVKVPDSITLPDSVNILGNGQGVKSEIYNKAMKSLEEHNYIDPSIFNEYSNIKNSKIADGASYSSSTFTGFNLPWGQVTLASSISGDSIDFPVYPEEISDSKKANYTTMPDLLYQYEPWQLYNSSGPRTNTYLFHFHRDMWTGDHRDGKANELIRYCEANCYPEFNGSAVNIPTVTLYIAGSTLIHGVMTQVDTKWDGPIGLDGFYLNCELSITITEISETALNYGVIKSKSLIG